MGIKFKLEQKGPGLKLVEKTLAELRTGETYVKVGVIGSQAGQKHDGDITNAELAAVHEFGTVDGHIPARSWIGSAFDANKDKYFGMLKTLLGRVVEGKMEIGRALGVVGLAAATDVKNNVTQGEGIPPPLKPATIAAKGSTRPLIDTGRMVGSVSHAVKLGGKDTSE